MYKGKYMKGVKSIIIVLMLIMAAVFNLKAQDMHQKAETFIKGEFLQYKVSYMFIRVGTLRIHNEGYTEIYGHKGNYVKFYVDSNPSIPFVTIHDIYETIMTDDYEPVYFLAHEDKGDYILKTVYDFFYDENYIHIYEAKIYKKDNRLEVTADSTTSMHNVYRDAVSLLFYARDFSSIKIKNQDVYTIAYSRKEKCFFDNSGVEETVKLRGEKFDAWFLDGNVKFIGIAGVKDGFSGWFSRDSRRIPLRAKMKAFFGSVVIELEDFANWDTDFGRQVGEVILKD